MNTDLSKYLGYLPKAMPLLLILLGWLLGSYGLCYLEQWGTFYYHGGWISGVACNVNGLCELLSLFVVQFFTHPLLAVCVNAAVLLLVYYAFRRYLMEFSGADGLLPNTFPLLLVALAMAAQHNSNLEYSYTGMLLLLSLCLWLMSALSGVWRLAVCLLAVPLLTYGAASGGLWLALLSVFVLRGWHRWLPVALWAVCAFVIFRMAWVGSFADLLGLRLCAVYTLREPAVAYACPAVMLASAVWACVRGRYSIGVSPWLYAVVLAVSLGVGFVMRGPSNEAFKKLNYMSRHDDYDGIMDVCSRYQNNVMFHNYRNMALAGKGILADSLFRHFNVGFVSLFLDADKSPFVKSTLSDVFYSMGLLSQSRMHAFEALQSSRNRSPKMLMRLAHTNIAFREYGVACRYLRLLATTMHYGDEARRLISIIESGEVERVFADKIRCVPPYDEHSGFPSLDSQLHESLRGDTSSRNMAEYLGCIYLLDKNLGKFASVVSEFYGKPCLTTLPRSFVEGLRLSYQNNADSLARYGISPDQNVSDYQKFYNTRFQ